MSRDGYPVGPLLERSTVDSGGPIEVGVSMSGTEPIDGNELDVFLARTTIDPGGRIELGIFVFGVGDLETTDLTVFYDDETLLDLENPGIVRRSAGTVPGRQVGTSASGSSSVGEGSSPDSMEYVQSASFRDGEGTDRGLERVPLDGSARAEPAYILELNTASDVSTGEVRIPVVFTYRSENGIKQVKQLPRLRIRSRRERWRPWLVRLAVVVAFGLVIALSWSSSVALG
ncbi:S-layer domain [Natrarchaeobaculum sulfurireducens]|uniref:S-layer domain n=1 Tax=Natrarchaeobaculum sulfurireducens TaxID=2044521 RepID=A0A346PVC4_9EURY|nr:S-layer domain [Natrarchaeobaculum sulfurireducens]AXR83469.1 S-layer domain [Natrarchaeobaculum sulfurireducens]